MKTNQATINDKGIRDLLTDQLRKEGLRENVAIRILGIRKNGFQMEDEICLEHDPRHWYPKECFDIEEVDDELESESRLLKSAPQTVDEIVDHLFTKDNPLIEAAEEIVLLRKSYHSMINEANRYLLKVQCLEMNENERHERFLEISKVCETK